MKYLSMGMTNSHKAAIEKGSNTVRIGTAIFEKRKYDWEKWQTILIKLHGLFKK